MYIHICRNRLHFPEVFVEFWKMRTFPAKPWHKLASSISHTCAAQLTYKFVSPSNPEMFDIKVYIFRNTEKTKISHIIWLFCARSKSRMLSLVIHSNLDELETGRSWAFTSAAYSICYGLNKRKQYLIQDVTLALSATLNILLRVNK